MKTKLPTRYERRIIVWSLRLVAGVLLLVTAAPAATSTGTSPVITVDTRVDGIAVSGRVREPFPGGGLVALVSLAGQITVSSGDGSFSFTGISLAAGNFITASKDGYTTYVGTVPAPAGATAVTLRDIVLVATNGGIKPIVTSLQAQREGLFLGGIALLNNFTATVDWQGCPPARVYF